MIVLPAIIPESLEDLAGQLHRVKNASSYVQIDVCDGRLTGEASWPYVGDSREFERIIAGEEGLPLWDRFDFEFDLMVLNPGREFERFIDAGASRIIIHPGGNVEKLPEMFKTTRDRGVEVGLALHMDHDISILDQYIGLLDVVQLMGIKQIGFQGQPFEESVLEKIKLIKQKYPDLIVSIDGGVNADTAERIVEAGADRLVVGSGIFKADNLSEAVRYFEGL